ncbi:MAG TPA: hypothetical protein VGK99_17525 [Acidobacteriota bacterium]|jgi:Spy/CpxP family protein refolding chaperone
MRDRQRALAVLLAVFLLGGIAGAGSFYLWLGPKVRANPDQTSRSERRHPKLSEELGLSKEQDVRFKEIMTQSRQQYELIRKEVSPRFQAVKAETDKKIRSILNDEQKVKFEAFLKRMDKEMESRRKRMSEQRW